MPSDESPILIVTGPPGVGKTTTAEILAARSSRAVHLEADVFFRFISSGHVEPWKPESQEQNKAVMGVVAKAAAGYAETGYFTIVDGIVIPAFFFEPLRDALHEEGHTVAYAVLRAPLPVCAARVQDREGGPLVESAVIEQLWNSFAGLGDLERNVIDLKNMTRGEAADLLERRLTDGTLTVT